MRDIAPGQEPFESKILRKYQRRSNTIDETFMKLLIEGLATRDFEPRLRKVCGHRALPRLRGGVAGRLERKSSERCLNHGAVRNFNYEWH